MSPISGTCEVSEQPDEKSVQFISVLSEPALVRAFRVEGQLIFGGAPQGDAGFRTLRRLGIRTVVSVDGAVPDVPAARRHGLRYVHVPFGYDGIPSECRIALCRVLSDAPGRVYLHCHHGRHRSAAAAAVALISLGVLDRSAGRALLHTAGTSPDYRGLWDAVDSAVPVSLDELLQHQESLPESVPPPPLVEAMGRAESLLTELEDRPRSVQDASEEIAMESPRQRALLLREQLKEMLRLPEVQQRSTAFTQQLERCRDLAVLLEQQYQQGAFSVPGRNGATEDDTGDRLIRKLRRQCRDCHQQFRD